MTGQKNVPSMNLLVNSNGKLLGYTDGTIIWGVDNKGRVSPGVNYTKPYTTMSYRQFTKFKEKLSGKRKRNS